MVVSGSARAGTIRTGKETEFGKVSETPRPFILPMSASHYRTFRFPTVANGYPSGYWPYCGGLYDCSRNGKKALLQKGEFLKRDLDLELLTLNLSLASFRSARQATHLAQVDEGDGSSRDLR